MVYLLHRVHRNGLVLDRGALRPWFGSGRVVDHKFRHNSNCTVQAGTGGVGYYWQSMSLLPPIN